MAYGEYTNVVKDIQRRLKDIQLTLSKAGMSSDSTAASWFSSLLATTCSHCGYTSSSEHSRFCEMCGLMLLPITPHFRVSFIAPSTRLLSNEVVRRAIMATFGAEYKDVQVQHKAYGVWK